MFVGLLQTEFKNDSHDQIEWSKFATRKKVNLLF